MKNPRLISSVLAVMVIVGLLLSACTPATPGTGGNTPQATAMTDPTKAPEPTKATEPTKVPEATADPEATTEPSSELDKAEVDCDYGGEFKSIETLDEHTVKFTLCAPDPAFLSKIAFTAFAIQSAAHLEGTGGGGDLLRAPIGTGPYMLTEWVEGDHITLEANPNFEGEAPVAKTLIFRWNTEASARLLELQAGTADGIDNPSPNDFATIEDDSNLALYPRDPLNIFYLGLNNTKEPFDKEEVRQAVAMAIDKQKIVDEYYPSGSIVATQFMPPAISSGYTEGFEDYEFNPQAAADMLAAAGYPDGIDIELSYRDVVRGYLPQAALVAVELQAQLAEANIRVTINVMESGSFLDAASNGDLQMFMLGWGADYPDATNFLDYHFGKGSNASYGDHWPEIEDKLAEAAALSDLDARNEIYAEVNELIKMHVPMVPIAHGASGTAFRADVEGAHASPLGNEAFAGMTPGDRDTFVWMQNAEPLSAYCADETDGETLRLCEQIAEPLMAYEIGGTDVIPGLASECAANEDATEWTCTLREGAMFSDGTPVTAHDVFMTFLVQWDNEHPLHVGNTGNFDYFTGFFVAFMHPPTP